VGVGGVGGGGGGEGGGGAGGGGKSAQMPLPDRMISGIIGKGGVIIREIIARSGAEVKVSQKDPNNVGGDRIVSITGPAESVALAQRMISERCRSVEQQLSLARPGGGGGFSPAPAAAASFAPPPPHGYSYDSGQQQLGYLHGMQGYGASQFGNAAGFGAAAQQQPYHY